MNCERVAPYLPGLAGGEIGEDTIRWVESHLDSCASCRADAARFRAVTTGLQTLEAHEIEPPVYLVDAIAEHVHAERRRRLVPVPPIIPAELIRVVQDNRDAIGAVAGAAILAASAAWVLRRVARVVRTVPRTANP